MKLNQKTCFICLGIVLVLVVIGIVVLGVRKQETPQNINSNININNEKSNNIKIEGTKKVGDIEFSNIRINLIGANESEFLADVKNTSGNFINSTKVRIVVIEEDGKIDEVFGGIVTELAGYEPNTFKMRVLSDITDAADVEIKEIE